MATTEGIAGDVMGLVASVLSRTFSLDTSCDSGTQRAGNHVKLQGCKSLMVRCHFAIHVRVNMCVRVCMSEVYPPTVC